MNSRIQFSILLLTFLLSATVFWFFHLGAPGLSAQERGKGPGKEKDGESLAETKEKGFEGVDFYYDVFGAPPGQDPQKTFEEVMKKDIAEKPQVMARQKQLLQERYQ